MLCSCTHARAPTTLELATASQTEPLSTSLFRCCLFVFSPRDYFCLRALVKTTRTIKPRCVRPVHAGNESADRSCTGRSHWHCQDFLGSALSWESRRKFQFLLPPPRAHTYGQAHMRGPARALSQASELRGAVPRGRAAMAPLALALGPLANATCQHRTTIAAHSSRGCQFSKIPCAAAPRGTLAPIVAR